VAVRVSCFAARVDVCVRGVDGVVVVGDVGEDVVVNGGVTACVVGVGVFRIAADVGVGIVVIITRIGVDYAVFVDVVVVVYVFVACLCWCWCRHCWC